MIPLMLMVLYPSARLLADPVHQGHAPAQQAHDPAQQGHDPALTSTDHDAPPRVNSLDVHANAGAIHLLIAVGDSRGPARLQYLRSDDHGAHWSTPVDVNPDGPAASVHRGMDAQIAADKENLIAVWTTASPDSAFGSGPMASALSDDGGKTWRPGPAPAPDSSKPGASQGFMDLAVDAAGTFHLVWLDARSGKQGLIHARSSDSGWTWSTQTLVPSTCECCWNALATSPDGRVSVLYRQHDPRDMAVIHSADHGQSWGQPVTVGGFGWRIKACPHCGGGIAFTRNDATGPVHCHAVVWTGRAPDGKPGIFTLHSSDDGKTWDPPRRIGDHTAYHPDLAAAPDGTLMVAFDAQRDGRSVILVAHSFDGGKNWSRPVQISADQALATHPRVVWTGRHFGVFWTQRDKDRAASWHWREVPGK